MSFETNAARHCPREERGFFESRAKAQEAIAAGLVSVDGAIVRKASESIAASAEIRAQHPYPWVSGAE